MGTPPDYSDHGNSPPTSLEDDPQLPVRSGSLLEAARAAIRDTTRLTRLFTVLSEPAPLELMLDRVLSTLSELFAADIVVLVDPTGSGTFSPLAAVGLPEYMVHLPLESTASGCVSKVMAAKVPIVKTAVSQDPAVESQFRELDTQAAVWLPVIGSHAARGALILARCHSTPFLPADVDLLAAMAYRIGLALEQAQRSFQLEQIAQAGRRISRSLEESEVFQEAVSLLPTVVGADAAALVLNDSSGGSRCVAQFGIDPSWGAELSRLAERLVADSRFASFQPFSTCDVHGEAMAMRPADGLPVRALLAVPVHREERIQGFLYAMRYTTAPFGADVLQVATLYAAQTSAALENAWLYRAAQEELAERMRAERRLCESEERLQLALKGADLGMWDWNMVTGEVSFNERWPAMLSYRPEEVEAHVRTREKLIHPEDLPGVRAALQAHLEGDAPYYETEHRICAKDGRWIWVLDKGKVTHRDAANRPLRFVGTCLDITEAKQIQAERLLIEEQRHRAWRAESLRRMAGGIAHHLNNMLQAVMGNLELALELQGQSTDMRSLLRAAMKASVRASEIGQLMLAYLGQKTGKVQPLDLSEAVRGVLPFLASSIPKNIHLKIDLPLHGPIIRADEAHIKQILTSLISNAVEAIGEGEGDIAVRMDVMALGEIGGSPLFPLDWEPEPGSYASVSISDTGCGMDTATQERLFEPFFSTKFTGRGMGMPVALGLLRSYGGAIAVESEPGRGTTIRLIFPAVKQEAPSL